MTNHERTERSAALAGAPRMEAGHVPGRLAAVLPVGAVFGPWFGPADGRGWQALLAAAVVALTALVPFVWLYRARSARRWRSALDAYAAREIAGDRRRKPPAP
jgi:hypothetical protein